MSKQLKQEIQSIIKITEMIELNDVGYFQQQNIPFLTSTKFTDVFFGYLYNRTLLHLVVWHNKINILQEILKKVEIKGMIDQCDINQETPLHLAFFDQRLTCACILLEAGAKFDIKNCLNQRPIDVLDGKKERQIDFLQQLLLIKLPSNEDHVKMLNMVKKKFILLNKMTEKEFDEQSQMLSKSEQLITSGISKMAMQPEKVVSPEKIVLPEMEMSTCEDIPSEACPKQILFFRTNQDIKFFGNFSKIRQKPIY